MARHESQPGFWVFAGDADAAAIRFAARHRTSLLDAIAKLASASGRGGLAWVAAVALAAVRGRGARAALPAAATVSAAFVASATLARLLGRRRPFVRTQTEPIVSPPRGPSCPSDHAAAAVAGAYLVAQLLPSHRFDAWAAATLVCSSRVYAGVHYPSDVLIGAALGFASGALWARS